jgi:hypothetical protein
MFIGLSSVQQKAPFSRARVQSKGKEISRINQHRINLGENSSLSKTGSILAQSRAHLVENAP